jgi:hypothetical protein
MDEDMIELVEHLAAAQGILTKPGRAGDFVVVLSDDPLGPHSVTQLCDILARCVRQAVTLRTLEAERDP